MTKNDLVLKVGVGLHLFIALFWIVPFIALCVRREHDLGHCGWKLLLDGRSHAHLWSQTSDPAANRYGPPPADAEK